MAALAGDQGLHIISDTLVLVFGHKVDVLILKFTVLVSYLQMSPDITSVLYIALYGTDKI